MCKLVWSSFWWFILSELLHSITITGNTLHTCYGFYYYVHKPWKFKQIRGSNEGARQGEGGWRGRRWMCAHGDIIRSYLNNCCNPLPYMVAIITDSHLSGSENWTDQFWVSDGNPSPSPQHKLAFTVNHVTHMWLSSTCEKFPDAYFQWRKREKVGETISWAVCCWTRRAARSTHRPLTDILVRVTDKHTQG